MIHTEHAGQDPGGELHGSEVRRPTETETHGMEREPEGTSLNQDIRARIMHPHKGDVGRAGTNEEIFQGSKQKELL